MNSYSVSYKTVLDYWKDRPSRNITIQAIDEVDAEAMIVGQFDNSCLAEQVYGLVVTPIKKGV